MGTRATAMAILLAASASALTAAGDEPRRPTVRRAIRRETVNTVTATPSRPAPMPVRAEDAVSVPDVKRVLDIIKRQRIQEHPVGSQAAETPEYTDARRETARATEEIQEKGAVRDADDKVKPDGSTDERREDAETTIDMEPHRPVNIIDEWVALIEMSKHDREKK